MLDSKRLRLNLLKILDLLDLKVVIGDNPLDSKNIDYPQINIVKFNPQRDRNIVLPTVCSLLKKISIILFIKVLVMSLLLTNGKKTTHGESPNKST